MTLERRTLTQRPVSGREDVHVARYRSGAGAAGRPPRPSRGHGRGECTYGMRGYLPPPLGFIPDTNDAQESQICICSRV